MPAADDPMKEPLLTALEMKQYGRMKVSPRQKMEYRFPTWTAVHDCENQSCIAVSFCLYEESFRQNKRCLVITNFLKAVEEQAYDVLGPDASMFDLYKIGMHILPLYKQYARMLMIEMSVTSRGIPETTKTGTTKIHGVFRELREINREIIRCWGDFGYKKSRIPTIPDLPVTPDEDYYERMEKDAKKENTGNKLVKRKA